MTLYLEGPADTFSAWRGTPINDVWYPQDIEAKWSSNELAAIGLYIPLPAEPVPEGKRSTGTAVQRVNGDVKFVHALEDIPAPTKQELLAYAAEKRWEKEASGVTVNGVVVMTDERSQGLINGAYNMAKENSELTFEFKAASGWLTLDAATVIAIGMAVGAHVQTCFAIEKAVAAAVAVGTITTYAEIDGEFA